MIRLRKTINEKQIEGIELNKFFLKKICVIPNLHIKKMKTFISQKAWLIIFVFSLALSSIPLNGPQHGEYERREYRVSETVVVPAGETMTIHAGSIFRFDQYCDLVVKGRLVCKSDSTRGVLFTASGSGGTIPLWNGIEVDSGGSVYLENCYIYNSVYGIKLSVLCRSFVIKNTRFRDNESDFSVGDSVVVVAKDTPFTFFRNILPEPGSPNSGIPGKRGSAERKRWKAPVRISLGAAAVAGCVLSVVFHNGYEDYKKQYDNAGEDASSIREKGNSALYRRNAMGIIGAAALAGFGVTFFF